MQTTLRIDDEIYREAKAKAAREGVTLTRFLEEGLRLRLKVEKSTNVGADHFRVFSTDRPEPTEWEEVVRIAEAEQEVNDLSKLGIGTATR